jgi:hypothetical protein
MLKGRRRGKASYFLLKLIMFDPMSELSDSSVSDDEPSTPAEAPKAAAPSTGGGGRFSDDLHSVTIRGRQRTFYIDLKKSANGKFFKVSEKSRGGQKTTIMFDSEDLPHFIAAFDEMKEKLASS